MREGARDEHLWISLLFSRGFNAQKGCLIDDSELEMLCYWNRIEFGLLFPGYIKRLLIGIFHLSRPILIAETIAPVTFEYIISRSQFRPLLYRGHLERLKIARNQGHFWMAREILEEMRQGKDELMKGGL